EAEMIDAAGRGLAAVAQERERQIAVAHVRAAARLPMDDLHAENLLVEFREPRGVLGLDRQMTDFRHGVLHCDENFSTAMVRASPLGVKPSQVACACTQRLGYAGHNSVGAMGPGCGSGRAHLTCTAIEVR